MQRWKKIDRDEALMEACREFEALFLSMMFKEMKRQYQRVGL